MSERNDGGLAERGGGGIASPGGPNTASGGGGQANRAGTNTGGGTVGNTSSFPKSKLGPVGATYKFGWQPDFPGQWSPEEKLAGFDPSMANYNVGTPRGGQPLSGGVVGGFGGGINPSGAGGLNSGQGGLGAGRRDALVQVLTGGGGGGGGISGITGWQGLTGRGR